MKPIFSISSMINRQIIVIPVVLVMFGCAVEEDHPTNKVQTEVSSTRLADNKLPSGMDFANFRDAQFNLDPSSLQLSGSRLFLKLTRDGDEVVFLGEIDRFLAFTIAVQVPLGDTKLFYELFTNDVNDATQFGVVEL